MMGLADDYVRAQQRRRAARRRSESPEQRRFYGSRAWKDLSARVRREEPLCRLCRVNPSELTDHIDGDFRNNDRGNLRGICRQCDRGRTARQHAAKSRR